MQIAGNEPDIIMITEVIPKAQIMPLSPAVLEIPMYRLFTNFDFTQARLGESGHRGVCIYIKESISAAEVSLYASTAMEQLWVSMNLVQGDKLLIGCIYMSPSGNRHDGMVELCETLKLGCKNASHILVAGDFNVPHVDWLNMYSEEPPAHFSHDLIRCLQDCFMYQHLEYPTRYRHGQTPSLLDLILTNEEGMIRDMQYLPGLSCSDHIILRFTLTCYTEHRKPCDKSMNYRRGDYNLLRSLLQKVDWTVLNDLDVPHAYHFFESTLNRVVTRAVSQSRPRPVKNLYITKQAARLKRKKATLWKEYTHSRDDIDHARFCRCRNQLRKLSRSLREDFEHRISKEVKHNPKVFWKYLNPRLKTKSGIEVLKDDQGNLTNNDQAKATILNKYFASVFTKEDLSTAPPPVPPNKHTVDDLMITEDMVKLKLTQLKSTSSPGPDNIHPKILKEAAHQLAKPLSLIYNKSISTGCLPDNWKLGEIVPIFKKGNRQEPGNYRPVSLTAIPCKVLESLIRDRLMSHLEEGQLLSQHQHGFRPKRSCSSQLLEVLEEWTQCIERGEPVDALYLDFRKAFDSVPHQ